MTVQIKFEASSYEEALTQMQEFLAIALLKKGGVQLVAKGSDAAKTEPEPEEKPKAKKRGRPKKAEAETEAEDTGGAKEAYEKAMEMLRTAAVDSPEKREKIREMLKRFDVERVTHIPEEKGHELLAEAEEISK